jgi:hypothetical protein
MEVAEWKVVRAPLVPVAVPASKSALDEETEVVGSLK